MKALVGLHPSHRPSSLLNLRVFVSVEGAHAVPGRSWHCHGEQLSLMHQLLFELFFRAGRQELLAEGDV